jgi:hypothetical protein
MANYRVRLGFLGLIFLFASIASVFAQSITFTTIDHPLGAKGTWVGGISGNNIVGSYKDAADATHGFVYNGSCYTTLDEPFASSASNYGGIGTMNPGVVVHADQ